MVVIRVGYFVPSLMQDIKGSPPNNSFGSQGLPFLGGPHVGALAFLNLLDGCSSADVSDWALGSLNVNILISFWHDHYC